MEGSILGVEGGEGSSSTSVVKGFSALTRVLSSSSSVGGGGMSSVSCCEGSAVTPNSSANGFPSLNPELKGAAVWSIRGVSSPDLIVSCRSKPPRARSVAAA